MKHIFYILLLLTSLSLLAQDTLVHSASFSKVYADSISWLYGTGGVELEDGFLITQININNDSTCMELMKINKLGEDVWRRSLYCVPTTVTYILLTGGTSNQIVQTPDGNYIMLMIRKNPLNQYDQDMGFVKFDKEGNVLWVNLWEDDLDLPSALFAFDNTSDGGFIGAGYYNYPGDPSRGYVVKMDSLCNIEWEWSETLEYGVFYSVFETTEGNFIAGGKGDGEGEVSTGADLYVVKLSSEGTLLSDFVYLNRYEDTPVRVIPYDTVAHTYLIAGGVWDENDWDNIKKQYVALLDSTLSPIWEKKHPSPLGDAMGFGKSIIIKEDGSFVGFGEHWDNDLGKDEIVLMWYNNEGDLTHTTHHNPTPEIDDHYTSDFKATSDGGYLIIGHDHLPAPKRTFVMKLDENGDVCNPADCIDYLEYEVIEDSTITPEDTVTSIAILEPSSLISVYPNPTSNQLTFHFSPRANPPTLSLYNNLGQVVKKEEIQPSKKILLTELPTGIYYWKLYEQSGKIIIK